MAAGWGGWAKRDGWDRAVTHGGAFRPGSMRTSSDAELFASSMFLCRLADDGLLEGIDAVMLQSDCMRVVQACLRNVDGARLSGHADSADVAGGGKSLSPAEAEAVSRITRFLDGRRLLLRHVRGHRTGGGRQKVNAIVDMIARRHMETVRGQAR